MKKEKEKTLSEIGIPEEANIEFEVISASCVQEEAIKWIQNDIIEAFEDNGWPRTRDQIKLFLSSKTSSHNAIKYVYCTMLHNWMRRFDITEEELLKDFPSPQTEEEKMKEAFLKAVGVDENGQ